LSTAATSSAPKARASACRWRACPSRARADRLSGRERHGLGGRGLGRGPALGRHPKGLASFISDQQGVPGRFNVFDYRGATVIADYGHNPDAIAALVAGVGNMPAKRRSVVISGAGDRRDEDIREQTRILGAAFDSVILYQDACQRGRADGEVLALLRQGLEGATRARQVEEIHGEFTAIDRALEQLQAGDLCLILIDQVQEALAHIQRRVDEARPATAKPGRVPAGKTPARVKNPAATPQPPHWRHAPPEVQSPAQAGLCFQREGFKAASAQQPPARRIVLAPQPCDQLGCRHHRLDGADALPAAPDVLPGLGGAPPPKFILLGSLTGSLSGSSPAARIEWAR
jgi:hypothetical protein